MQGQRDSICITPFKKEFYAELRSLFLSNSEDTYVLKCGFFYEILESVGLLPSMTRLVAYEMQQKRPIGFVALEETTKTLFSLQFLFVNPKYRKMGIGTRLLEAAIVFAKKKKASRINLVVYPNKSSTIDLYKRYGFKELGRTVLVQGFLPFSTSNVIKRGILRRNGLNIEPFKNRLSKSSLDSLAEKRDLFEIFQSCMNKDWSNFFNIKYDNLKSGSRNIWLPHFVKALVSNDKAFFALLFNQPFPPRDIVELYLEPDIPLEPLLEDLLSILSTRGIGLTKVWLFGQTYDLTNEWLQKKQLIKLNFLCMGKIL